MQLAPFHLVRHGLSDVVEKLVGQAAAPRLQCIFLESGLDYGVAKQVF